MYIKEYLSNDYPVFNLSDSISMVKEAVRDFDFSHIFIQKNKSFLGGIHRDLLKNSKAQTIKDIAMHSERFIASEDEITLDVIRYFYTFNTNIVPVMNRNEEYLGYITPEDIFKDLSKYPLFSENAAVLVVETAVRNYSMAEVAQIVESNKAKFYGSFIYHMTDEIIQIALKISPANMMSVEAAFDRFGYLVLHKFYIDRQEEILKDRFDFLQKYMEI